MLFVFSNIFVTNEINKAHTSKNRINFTAFHLKEKELDTQRIIHGRAEIWNLSSSVHIDIERVSAANE